jgi:hypothetical protein
MIKKMGKEQLRKKAHEGKTKGDEPSSPSFFNLIPFGNISHPY